MCTQKDMRARMVLYAYCSQAATNTAERQRDISEIEDCFHRVPDDGWAALH